MAEPLILVPVMQEKIWGGQSLNEVFGYELPSQTVGECWAISAHPNGVTQIKNGKYAGMGLDEVYRCHPDLFGYPSSPVFPLLTKILDANDWLSVQVHPDDSYALAHEGELGKTECWYVLQAQEGAEIIYGHDASTKEELKEWIVEGRWDDLLTRVPVKTGDFFYVPSGTMHAIGRGIMILETQQSSDTTYRVYDFDRVDAKGQKRELHLEESIDVLNLGVPENSQPARLDLNGFVSTLLVSNTFFTVYRWEISREITMNQSAPYLLVSVCDGKGRLMVDDVWYDLKKGEHLILPFTVTSWVFDGEMDLIVSHPNND